MKKFIALLAVLCMMLSMTGCLGEDLMTKYENAVEKTNALRQIDMDLKLSLSIKASGDEDSSSLSMDIPINMNIKAIIDDDDKIDKMDMSMNMNVMSQSMEFSLIYLDEESYIYSNSGLGEQKFKQTGNINDTDDNSVMIEDMSSFLMLEDYIDEDILAESEVENSDGETIIKLDLSAKELNKLLKEFVDEFSSAMSSASGSSSGSILGDEDSMKITDSSIKLAIDKNGYISKTNFDITYEAVIEGVTAEIGMKIKQSLNNPGEDVKIKAPADKESYQSISED